MDYYSLVKNIESDLKTQSKTIADIFLEEGISLEYVSLHDGIIEENPIVFWQNLYGVVQCIISPEKGEVGLVKIFAEGKKHNRIKKASKKLNYIISHFFEKEKNYNKENEMEEDNVDNLLLMRDKVLREYEHFIDSEEEDCFSVIEDYINRNEKAAKKFEENVKAMFYLWKGKKQ